MWSVLGVEAPLLNAAPLEASKRRFGTTHAQGAIGALANVAAGPDQTKHSPYSRKDRNHGSFSGHTKKEAASGMEGRE